VRLGGSEQLPLRRYLSTLMWTSFLARWGDLLAAGLLAVHAAIAWLTRSVGVGIGNDSAAYLLLSRSIASLSYRDFHVVGAPVHAQYPPGFPALLAVVSAPFGENIPLLIAVMIALSVAALAVVYVSARSRGGHGLALCVLAPCALNPALINHAGMIVSEVPYLLLTALTVWVILREPEQPADSAASGRTPIVAGLAAILSALMRSIGATMVAALLLHWVLTRRYRRVLIVVGVSALTVGAWLTASFVLTPVQSIGRSYFADATFTQSAGRPFIATLLQRVLHNIPDYATVTLPWALTRGTIPGTIVDNIIGLLVTVVVGSVGFWVMWKQARFVVLYLACYGTLLLLWPWGGPRLLVPVLPFLLWTGMAGAFRLSAGRRWLRPLPACLGLLVVAIGVFRASTDVLALSRCDRSDPLASACFPDAERAFFAAAEFVRDATPDSAIILTHIETVLAYESSRTVLLEESVDPHPDRILGSLRSQGVDYVVLTPLRPLVTQHVRALRDVCGELELVEEFYPVTLLLRVAPPSSTRDVDGCEAIQRFEREHPAWGPT
jgi:hypothetical protein